MIPIHTYINCGFFKYLFRYMCSNITYVSEAQIIFDYLLNTQYYTFVSYPLKCSKKIYQEFSRVEYFYTYIIPRQKVKKFKIIIFS